jgi:putative acyl-CoA dehydrogenase
MRNVLADLAVESEAATALGIRLAAAVDDREAAFKRLALAVGKYWVCKRAPVQVGEALECLGGNGYVEESGLPRLYREAPLNSIWEGSGNVNVLDAVRAMTREADTLPALLAEVGRATGADRRLDDAVGRLQKELADRDGLEGRGRRVVELMALVLQGSLLVRFAPAYVADAFCASRLDRDWGAAFGTLPVGVDAAALVERARPTLA